MTYQIKFALHLSSTIILFISFAINTYSQTEIPTQRRDLNSLSPSELATLRDLILQWTPDHIADHAVCGCHGTNTFFSWHRGHIQQLEQFLITELHPEFVPLPKWSPDTPIPSEFLGTASVVPGYDPPANGNPNISIADWDGFVA